MSLPTDDSITKVEVINTSDQSISEAVFNDSKKKEEESKVHYFNNDGGINLKAQPRNEITRTSQAAANN